MEVQTDTEVHPRGESAVPLHSLQTKLIKIDISPYMCNYAGLVSLALRVSTYQSKFSSSYVFLQGDRHQHIASEEVPAVDE